MATPAPVLQCYPDFLVQRSQRVTLHGQTDAHRHPKSSPASQRLVHPEASIVNPRNHLGKLKILQQNPQTGDLDEACRIRDPLLADHGDFESRPKERLGISGKVA